MYIHMYNACSGSGVQLKRHGEMLIPTVYEENKGPRQHRGHGDRGKDPSALIHLEDYCNQDQYPHGGHAFETPDVNVLITGTSEAIEKAKALVRFENICWVSFVCRFFFAGN